ESRVYAEKQTKYNVVVAHTEHVNAALANDRKGGGFKKLRQVAGEELRNHLTEYHKTSLEVEANLMAVRAHAFRVAAALAAVEQAENALESYDKEKERGAEAAKLPALKQKLEVLKGMLNFAIDGGKDPTEAAKDL